MTIHNILKIYDKCPHCGKVAEIEIEMHLGKGDLIEYQIGDMVEWIKGKTVPKGGPPNDGNMDVDGYAECEHCGLDFFLNVHIRDNRIVGVDLNASKNGYMEIP